jgi:hypothetical protein
MSPNERGDRTVDRVPLMTAERVAGLVRARAWRAMSLRLVDALQADTPVLARRPGLGRGKRGLTARRRAWETHTRRERASRAGPLGGSGWRLEAFVA